MAAPRALVRRVRSEELPGYGDRERNDNHTNVIELRDWLEEKNETLSRTIRLKTARELDEVVGEFCGVPDDVTRRLLGAVALCVDALRARDAALRASAYLEAVRRAQRRASEVSRKQDELWVAMRTKMDDLDVALSALTDQMEPG